MLPRRASLTATALALLLAACSSPAPQTRETPIPADLTGSARIIHEANRLPSPAKEDRLLDAVPVMVNEGDLSGAEALVQAMDPSTLPLDLRADLLLAKASLALKRGHYRRVLDMLSLDRTGVMPRAGELSLDRQNQISLLRASALEGLGDRLSAANERIFVGSQLEGPQLAANNQRIWDDLSRLPTDSLRQLASTTAHEDLRGWLELVFALTSASNDPLAQGQAFRRWSEAHPTHPAAKSPPRAVADAERLAVDLPRQVAVILPRSGPVKAAADALQQGFLTAWHEGGGASDGGFQPILRFYDEGSPADINQVYARAISDGAQAVVGPFGKDALRKLCEGKSSLPTPTLALNYSDLPSAPANLFQFGLSAEDDAREAADHAAALGYTHAAVIYRSGSGWYERVQQAFSSRWKESGRVIVDVRSFRDKAEMEGLVRSLLDLDESRQRAARIASVIGQSIDHEPRPRSNLDTVYLAMETDDARQMKPLFNFHYARQLPLMGGFYLNNGASAETHQDLDGIVFSDIPWVLAPGETLQPAFSAAWPDANPRLSRLHAMGADAFRLTERLGLLSSTPGMTIEGATGSLQADSGGKIHRGVIWGRFDGGHPVMLPRATGGTTAP